MRTDVWKFYLQWTNTLTNEVEQFRLIKYDKTQKTANLTYWFRFLYHRTRRIGDDLSYPEMLRPEVYVFRIAVNWWRVVTRPISCRHCGVTATPAVRPIGSNRESLQGSESTRAPSFFSFFFLSRSLSFFFCDVAPQKKNPRRNSPTGRYSHNKLGKN